MSRNVNQIYIANPTTTVPNTALIYIGLSPFGITNDSAVTFANFQASIATLTNVTLVTPASLGVQQQALNMQSFQINNLALPSTGTDATNRNYVDNIATGGGAPCQAATTANLTATYSNVAGTLTNSGSQAAFVVDGYTASLGDRILVKNQSTTYQNGVYTVTVVGTNATNWVLTRAADYNTVDDINDTGVIPIINGTANTNTGWYNTTVMIAIGTTAITFVQFGGVAAKAGFSAYVTSTSGAVTGDGTSYTLAGFTTVKDNLSNFNASTGVFTAPTTGLYLFTTTVALANLTSNNLRGQVTLVAGSDNYDILGSWANQQWISGSVLYVNLSQVVYLTATQTASVFIYENANGSKNVEVIGGGTNGTWFSGAQIA